ncbi:hypothetical protein [Fibrobacter sp.]|uniref:hypothetical protein n=1 Tax=Fibrobacter sp. TaxID=35828 RepID=UPI00388EDC14
MLTQENYCIYTGQTVNYSDSDWQTLVSIASKRLASLLCLETFPELTDENKDLAMLLANFICATLKFQGAPDTIESKSVRNFTINFKSSATNAFGQIYHNYEDIIEAYSNCGSDIKVERNARHCCGYYNNGLLNF